MHPMNLSDLQPLLAQFEGEGHVLSCYADLAGADGFRPNWEGLLGEKANSIAKAIETGHPARREFEANLAAVRATLQNPPASGFRWLAVFSARQRDFLKAVPLDVPVGAELVSAPSPYLVPLLTAIHRRREYLAVHTDSHRGRIYSASPGAVRLLDELDADVPARQHSAGELWGQSQATIARHRDDAILHYQKDLSHRIERAWAESRYTGLILFGPGPALDSVKKVLPKRLGVRVTRETPASFDARPAEIQAAIRDATLELSVEDEAHEVVGLWDRLAAGRAVATGPKQVLEAIEGGRIGPGGQGYLVFGPDPRETVGKCTVCQALALDAPSTCPRCQAPCALRNLWEELLLQALRHNIRAHFIDNPTRLAPYCGIVAALSRADAAGSAAKLASVSQS